MMTTMVTTRLGHLATSCGAQLIQQIINDSKAMEAEASLFLLQLYALKELQ